MRQAINKVLSVALCAIWLLIIGQVTLAQTTQFTYQGKLSDGGAPANGPYDLQFKLFDTETVGTGAQLGSTLTPPPVTVTGGIFTVPLDFGVCASCFNGSPRFLEIAVRPASVGGFTTLSPRQQVTSNPYAIKSLNAATADGLSVACVNCVTSTQIQSVSGSQVSGLIPVTSVPAGSASYVQNQTALSQPANFNINGTGTANIFSAATQYNIGVQRMLSAPGGFNTFVGRLAGRDNTGSNNTFVGDSAGVTNTTGSSNAFFGNNAGQQNSTGSSNAFFGEQAGFGNSAGSDNNSFFGQSAGRSNAASDNAFFGALAGADNSIGNGNSFFGKEAGRTNTDGFYNSFFGALAGHANLVGVENSFFGVFAGLANEGGSDNSFFGMGAGFTNTTGSKNTIIGSVANVGANNLTNATAIGANAVVSQSNSLVLGNGVNVGIGTGSPQSKLHVVGQDVNVEGTNPGIFPRFSLNFTGGGVDEKRWQNYAAPNSLVFSALNDLNNAETAWLQVNRGPGTAISSVGFPNGLVLIGNLGAAGTDHLCLNGSFQISSCLSSSIRYKQNINSFTQGLSLIKQLRPVTFNWKANNQADFGLVAEEVNQVEPLLTTTNAKGEIEGVKYDRVGVVLVNAVLEQQQQIESQQKQLDEQKQLIRTQQVLMIEQQKELETLKILVCSQNPTAETCKSRK